MELVRLKKLLGIQETDNSQDDLLQFVIDDVEETIKNYCNLDQIPEGLTSTAYRMAMDLYRYDQPGESGVPMVVASISEGDTSTSFTGMAEVLAGGILKDYQGQLNRYRKFGW